MLLLSMGLAACSQPAIQAGAASVNMPRSQSNTLPAEPGQSPPVATTGTPPTATASPPDFPYENYLITVIPNLWESLGEKLTPPEGLATPITEGRPRKDLWDRVRAGLALPYRSHPRVLAEAEEYAASQDYLNTVTWRAKPYMYYVVREVEKRGMPTEIALVPIIESAFLASAKSTGGAAGVWQFIPSTGRHFGLKQTFWYDGRRDVIASTDAALKYLQRLNTDFDGDWLLTLAAYNAGENAVQRAVKKNQQTGKATDFWSLDLSRETEAYVPRLLGIAAIVENPELFGVTLNSIPDAPYLASVDIDSQINLDVAARIAGISRRELTRLNPGLLRGVTDPKGRTRLLLPANKAARFSARLAALAPDGRMSPSRAHLSGTKRPAPTAAGPAGKAQGSLIYYVVREGDSLAGIALKFKISVAQLSAWNANRLGGKYLKPGLRLRLYIPAAASEQ